jgi:hypothetical protein
MTKFIAPDFSSGSLELRFEHDTVGIYGNKEGLRALIGLCQRLLDRPDQGHIHLEDQYVADRPLLTNQSRIGAIALLE